MSLVGIKSARLPEWNMNDKGTLYISQSLLNQIEYLHREVKAIEWCGPLIYEKLEGDISNPASLKIRAHHVYPMDIGSAAHTSATFSADEICNVYDAHPELLTGQYKQGLIHTHHNMSTFFSGTDMEELHDNTPNHNYYLSLIVNFSGDWKAKIAFVATLKEKTKQTFSFKNSEDAESSFALNDTREKRVLMMIDMDIVKEGVDFVSEEFRARFRALQEKVRVRSYARSTLYPAGGGSVVYHQGPNTGTQGTPAQGGGSDAYKGKSSMEQGQLWQQGQSQRSGSNAVRRPQTQETREEEWNDSPHLEDWERTNGGLFVPRGVDPTFPTTTSGTSSGSGFRESNQERKETTNSSIAKTRNGSGKIIQMSDSDAKKLVKEWLEEGCFEEMDMRRQVFASTEAALAFYETYFEKDFETNSYSYWLDTMAKALYFASEDYTPAIVSTRVARAFEPYMSTSRVAHDLWAIADKHMDTYVSMEEERRARRRQEMNNNKSNY